MSSNNASEKEEEDAKEVPWNSGSNTSNSNDSTYCTRKRVKKKEKIEDNKKSNY